VNARQALEKLSLERGGMKSPKLSMAMGREGGWTPGLPPFPCTIDLATLGDAGLEASDVAGKICARTAPWRTVRRQRPRSLHRPGKKMLVH